MKYKVLIEETQTVTYEVSVQCNGNYDMLEDIAIAALWDADDKRDLMVHEEDDLNVVDLEAVG